MQRKSPLLGSVMLIVCAMIWGSGFVVMKEALSEVPVACLLGIRFTGSGLVLALCFAPRLRRLSGRLLAHGLLVSLLLWGAYMAQTFGLSETTPGKNAFLTASYCVFVPFCTWLIAGRRPTRRNVLAGLLCIAGIGLISLNEGLSMERGDALTLLCGVIFGFQVTMVGIYGERDDAVLLTVVQILAAGLLFLLTALLTEDPPRSISAPMLGQLIYLILLPTALTNLLQNVGQTMVSPAAAGILLSLESVFGTLCSVLFYGEVLSPRLLLGFGVVFLAVLCSQWPARPAPEAASSQLTDTALPPAQA